MSHVNPGTNHDVLTSSAYVDDRHLAARQSLYQFQNPQHDLPEIATGLLVDTSGIVLDVGCGNGRYVSHLRAQRPDLTVVGVDISPGILAEIKAPVMVADAVSLPYPKDSVSAILAMHMLYHLPNVETGLREFARILSPGGALVVSTNAKDDKAELNNLWLAAASDVLGENHEAQRVSLSDNFALDDAPACLKRYFTDVALIELTGIISVATPEPVLAHFASYRSFTDVLGIPLDDVLDRARVRINKTIAIDGAFTISCRSGILKCHARQ